MSHSHKQLPLLSTPAETLEKQCICVLGNRRCQRKRAERSAREYQELLDDLTYASVLLDSDEREEKALRFAELSVCATCRGGGKVPLVRNGILEELLPRQSTTARSVRRDRRSVEEAQTQQTMKTAEAKMEPVALRHSNQQDTTRADRNKDKSQTASELADNDLAEPEGISSPSLATAADLRDDKDAAEKLAVITSGDRNPMLESTTGSSTPPPTTGPITDLPNSQHSNLSFSSTQTLQNDTDSQQTFGRVDPHEEENAALALPEFTPAFGTSPTGLLAKQ